MKLKQRNNNAPKYFGHRIHMQIFQAARQNWILHSEFPSAFGSLGHVNLWCLRRSVLCFLKPSGEKNTCYILIFLRQCWENFCRDNSVSAELKWEDLSFGRCAVESVKFSDTEWLMKQCFPNVFQMQCDKVVFQITDFRFVLIFFIVTL